MENITETVQICDSYENTAQLLERFPVMNPTPVVSDMEKKIQNRLLNGFENWNRGTAAWMKWGDILYTPDSLYNVHGVHLTLSEYQATSNLSFKKSSMMMGNFNNMVICGDWCAIRYDITSVDRASGIEHPGSVMEFVKFKDYGEQLGARVVEGWAGTRGKDYNGLMHFLNEEEKVSQTAFMDQVAATVIPETDDLEAKYPVHFPTPANSPIAAQMKDAIVQEFDLWNQGDAWTKNAGCFFTKDFICNLDGKNVNREEYLSNAPTDTRLYFENMLLSGDWAAIHFRTRKHVSGEADNEMRFLHFVQTDDGVKVDRCWVK